MGEYRWVFTHVGFCVGWCGTSATKMGNPMKKMDPSLAVPILHIADNDERRCENRRRIVSIVTRNVLTTRVLVKHLDGVSDADILELNIPTGIPLVYELDEQWKPIRRYYLGDAGLRRKAMQAVATQVSLKGSP